jgi:hypothetical protein
MLKMAKLVLISGKLVKNLFIMSKEAIELSDETWKVREKESIGKKMLELMKVREERKIKEKKVKTNKKTIWGLTGGAIVTIGIEFIFFR